MFRPCVTVRERSGGMIFLPMLKPLAYRRGPRARGAPAPSGRAGIAGGVRSVA